jgi:hypothetical protein
LIKTQTIPQGIPNSCRLYYSGTFHNKRKKKLASETTLVAFVYYAMCSQAKIMQKVITTIYQQQYFLNSKKIGLKSHTVHIGEQMG